MEIISKKHRYMNHHKFRGASEEEEEEKSYTTNPFDNSNGTSYGSKNSATRQTAQGLGVGSSKIIIQERSNKGKELGLKIQALNKNFQNILKMFALEVYKTSFNELSKISEVLRLIQTAEGAWMDELTSSLEFFNLLSKIRGKSSEAVSNLGKQLRSDLLRASHYRADKSLVAKFVEVERKKNFLEEDCQEDEIDSSLSCFLPLISKFKNVAEVEGLARTKKENETNNLSGTFELKKEMMNQLEFSLLHTSKDSSKRAQDSDSQVKESQFLSRDMVNSLFSNSDKLSLEVEKMVAELPRKPQSFFLRVIFNLFCGFCIFDNFLRERFSLDLAELWDSKPGQRLSDGWLR